METKAEVNQPGSFSTPVKFHPQTCSISKVRVVVRVRPFLAHEISSRNGNASSCVSLLESESSFEEVTLLLKDQESSRKECYKLDAFFGQEDNNLSQIFEKEVAPLIPGLFQGFNATVFAYGATGSGKTYTMQGSEHLPGLMWHAMTNILAMCKFTGSTIAISYYEIYLDKCYDLIEPKEKEIMVWNDKDGQMHLKGLGQVEVDTIAKFNQVFSSAIQRRKVAHTGLNDTSSRSHGVLLINISTPSHDKASHVITGKLNLIDLAGNEDNRKSCNEGIRLQESAKINQSLFTLSNVIYALNNNKLRIPYRESKLTRILQDSLGGSSRALMVTCLNPGEYQESVNTVSLAARSRHVSNFVCSANKTANSKVKVDMETKLQTWLESKGKSKSTQRMGLCHSAIRGKTPSSVIPMRRLNTSAVKDQSAKQRSPTTASRNLFLVEGSTDHIDKAKTEAAAETNKKRASLTDESLFVDDNEKEELYSPQRKALSPINSNVDSINSCLIIPSDPKTPNSHAVLRSGANNIQWFGTPLDKFTARSSNLKNSLVQDYIEFLNTASREELLKLKGIGEKIAEYIVELRETSPLKSLSDLEKIGFSTKQVHNMFGRAARGVFFEGDAV
ncbi:kinesin-like protein KIN-10B [Andrographis paniculata]|uniref:kinesin-like protein KIN-10B n=1 Tax=Andrographis paniculata TaxID=175694 RepID=UPI0021E7503C|nr:kinesin-like protein KIN-10B [Andrographis paniculata]